MKAKSEGEKVLQDQHRPQHEMQKVLLFVNDRQKPSALKILMKIKTKTEDEKGIFSVNIHFCLFLAFFLTRLKDHKR